MEHERNVSLTGLEGHSLVLSCVSVGNVGQLAVDVLLASLQAAGQLELLSQLHHPAVIPVVGADPIQAGADLTCGLQLYRSAQHKLLILQVRSGLLPGTSGGRKYWKGPVRKSQMQKMSRSRSNRPPSYSLYRSETLYHISL